MKLSTSLALMGAAAVNAHYTFDTLVANGAKVGAQWQYVRTTENKYSHGPVTDVNSAAIRCYEDPSRGTTQTYTVAAGSNLGVNVDPSIQHPGPTQFYLAKVPSGKTAATWDGSGNVWFKIYTEVPTSYVGNGLTWPSSGKTTLSVKLPSSLPSGDYLFRAEHIGLHSAGQSGGAQFYLSCSQITVTGGGNGSPSPLVSFPGAYKATDPGILINLYYPVPTSYTPPGPAVWQG